MELGQRLSPTPFWPRKILKLRGESLSFSLTGFTVVARLFFLNHDTHCIPAQHQCSNRRYVASWQWCLIVTETASPHFPIFIYLAVTKSSASGYVFCDISYGAGETAVACIQALFGVPSTLTCTHIHFFPAIALHAEPASDSRQQH